MRSVLLLFCLLIASCGGGGASSGGASGSGSLVGKWQEKLEWGALPRELKYRSTTLQISRKGQDFAASLSVDGCFTDIKWVGSKTTNSSIGQIWFGLVDAPQPSNGSFLEESHMLVTDGEFTNGPARRGQVYVQIHFDDEQVNLPSECDGASGYMKK